MFYTQTYKIEKIKMYLPNMEWRGLFFMFGVWFQRNLLSFPAQWTALDILHFKAMGQTNQSLDSSIPPSSAPSTSTLLIAICDETDRNICSLEDSMDFLCSEEVIRVRDTILCYKYVLWNGFFYLSNWTKA